jgi:hypothetical protein
MEHDRMNDLSTGLEPFLVRDCALIALATGERALNLRELHDRLEEIEPGSLYFHFWGGLLRPRFDEPEYNNDFASWARHALHDWVLAERLTVIDPTHYADLEDLRRELLEVCEERLDEREIIPWARQEQQFHFLTSQIVVFDTGRRLHDPRELVELSPRLSRGSIFYHFIDARRRNEDGVDDVRAWLAGADGGHRALRERLADVDPFFSSLSELRTQLADIFAAYFGGEDQ